MKTTILITLLPILLTTQGQSNFLDFHIHHGFKTENEEVVFSNFDYFAKRGVNTFSFPLPVDRSKTENLFLRIKKEVNQLKQLSEESGKFNIADSAKSIDLSFANLILSIEYFYGIFNGNIESVKNYKELGIRSITIYNNDTDRLFNENSLTPFGQQIIKEMNKHKILIDISHINEEQKLEAINYSESPVIVSHSNTRKHADMDYNLSDNVLSALNQNKGYVFVSFNKNGLYKGSTKEQDAIAKFVDHIDYLVNSIGIDYVGIGSDYQASGKYVPTRLNEKSSYKNIRDKLLTKNYSPADIRKIMFDNAHKVLKGTF